MDLLAPVKLMASPAMKVCNQFVTFSSQKKRLKKELQEIIRLLGVYDSQIGQLVLGHKNYSDDLEQGRFLNFSLMPLNVLTQLQREGKLSTYIEPEKQTDIQMGFEYFTEKNFDIIALKQAVYDGPAIRDTNLFSRIQTEIQDFKNNLQNILKAI